jgi:hypothetical protein
MLLNYSQKLRMPDGSYVHVKWLRQFENTKVNSQNYIKVYCAWCAKNTFIPLTQETLAEIFAGCETELDYELALKYLTDLQKLGVLLTFMPKDKKDTLEILTARLKLRLELFKRVPSATNMLLAYNLIEELTLKSFKESPKDLNDEINKNIDRFDKLKNLALGTKYIEERKLAFERSLEAFKKITSIEV